MPSRPAHPVKFTGENVTSNATYWHGVATTVDNEWYAVTAETQVEVLILNTGIYSSSVPTVVGGTFAKDAFSQLYGPIAAQEAVGMAPLVNAFYDGTLPMSP